MKNHYLVLFILLIFNIILYIFVIIEINEDNNCKYGYKLYFNNSNIDNNSINNNNSN